MIDMAASSSSIVDSLFQRTLDDLIKSLRYTSQQPHGALVSKAMDEIRREIKSTDSFTKSIALQKLCYLSSLHFVDMSWASFHAVECISSHTYAHKRVGYLSISQSFNESTPVILLITNQLRKDLRSSNEFEVSLALECLSRIGTLDLCRDLTPEIFSLMSSSKVFLRKKAIGVLLRVFEQHPESVKVCFMRLVENLACSESSSLSVVAGVFCELASKDPSSYLPLAPEFYKILTDSRNNWVLIKVLKIFAKIAPLESRLGKKIVDPVCEIMRRTDAKSLMFECIRTIAISLPEHESAVKLAVEKLQGFLTDDDPNLKYLGLNALTHLSARNSWAVLENKEIVVKSLSDADPNIKLESLHLLMSLVTENNVQELSTALVSIAIKSDQDFCNEILASILSTCSEDDYHIIIDFDWYVSLLGEICRIPQSIKGEEIGSQLIDIALRVRDIRNGLVRVCRDLLIDPALLGNPFLVNVLSSAAWICGQYVEYCRDVREILDSLLQPRTSLLPSSAKSIYIHSCFKILVFSLNREKTTMESVVSMVNTTESCLASSLNSDDLEVQERARNVVGLASFVRGSVSVVEPAERTEFSTVLEFIRDAVSEEVDPVSTSAQGRVRVPEGLILLEDLSALDELITGMEPVVETVVEAVMQTEPSSLLAEHRKRHDLYYLISEGDEYPPAKELRREEDEDVRNMVERSLTIKKKKGGGKARPVVVKVEEREGRVKCADVEDHLVGCAVRDVLSSSAVGSMVEDHTKGKQKGKETEMEKKGRKHRHKKTRGNKPLPIPDLLL